MSKMKNESVIVHFVERTYVDATNHSDSLRKEGNKLMNYGTCIAQFVAGVLYINETKYSSTTSKLQNMVKRHAAGDFKLLNNIEIGTRDLESQVICQHYVK